MARLADWIQSGTSGAVVGMGGSGKSNLLGFLCHRPDALAAHLPAGADPVAVVLVDLNDLPSPSLATFYRVLLRAFHEARPQFDGSVQAYVATLFDENKGAVDPFVAQTALRELLFRLQAEGLRVVLVMDRFDKFCATATPALTDTLRALRDGFKGTLVYIMGMRQEVAYLADREVLGELHEVLDTHTCWVGAMDDGDARAVIEQETRRASPPPSDDDVWRVLALTGGYPALLKAASHWWLARGAATPPATWRAALLAEPSVRYRLAEIWDGLTQAEQLALSEVRRLDARTAALAARTAVEPAQALRLVDKAWRDLDAHHRPVLHRLADKRLCEPEGEDGRRGTDSGAAGDVPTVTWRVRGDLLAAYLDQPETEQQGRGRIWRDAKTGELYQGQTPLEGLANLEHRLLSFLLDHPRTRHAKTTIVEHVWPDEVVAEGVMDDALYQVVKELRRKIEPESASPRYLVTWRGRPEGGYQFFAEGRPGGGG